MIESLKSRMVLAAVLMTAGILAGAGGLAFLYFESEFKDMISREQFSLLTAKADDVDDKIESAHQALISVSHVVPEGIWKSPSRARTWLDDRTGISSIFDNGVSLLDRNGILIAETPADPRRIGGNFSDREYIRQTVATGLPVLSEPFVSRRSHQHPVIAMTSPVVDARGRVAAVLIGTIDLLKDNFLGSIAHTRVGREGYLYLFDRNGILIIHPDHTLVLEPDGPGARSALLEPALNGFEGSVETASFRGAPSLSSYKRMRTLDWILASSFPLGEAYAPVKKAGLYFLAVLAGALLFTVVVVWLVMKRMISPLLALARHVKKLPSLTGEARLFPLRSRDEIGELASAFNGMIGRLDLQNESVRRSEERLRTFIESNLDGVYFTDRQGIFREINGAGAAILGHASPAEVIGRPASDYWVDSGERERFLAELRARRSVRAFMIHGRRIDGTDVYVEATSRLVDDEGGRAAGIEGILRDNTERVRAERELEEKSRENRGLWEFTRTILDSMSDSIAIIDAATFRISDVNRAFLIETGKKREEVIGKTCYEVTHGRTGVCEPPEHACPVRDLLSSGRLVTVEHEHHDAANGPVYAEISVLPIRDDAGRIAQILHVSRDITGRKQSEAELLTKHRELQGLFEIVASAKREWEGTIDATSDMLILLDGNGSIKRCNRAFRDLTGRSYVDLIGKKWRQISEETGLTSKSGDEAAPNMYHAASGRWFQSTTHAFHDVDGSERTVIAIHDMTEVRNAAWALELTYAETESRRQQFEAAVDEISHLIQEVTLKKDFSVRFTNPNLKRCWEVMNCDNGACPCHGTEGARCWQAAGTFCETGATGSFTDKFRTCSECPTFRLSTTDPIYQVGESFNNMMHILEEQHIELEQAYDVLKKAQAQLLQREKMASIGQLAAGVAHEINNPTGYIMSNLGSLQKYLSRLTEFLAFQDQAIAGLQKETAAEAARKKAAMKIDFIVQDLGSLVRESLEGAERIKKIVQDLKSFSRVDEAEQKPSDINAGLDSTVNIAWNELKYRTTVRKEYGELPLTKCNAGQLNQVFMNLLVNAAHAIEKQGEITIRTWTENGSILVSIADSGCGIPPDSLNRIFEPFFTTKPVGTGTGLGLSIAYDIIKKHNGDISVDSQVGKGTTFTIRIPVVQDEPQQKGGPQ